MSRTMARRNSNTSYPANTPQASNNTAEQVSKMTSVSFRLMGMSCSRVMLSLLLCRFRFNNLSQTEQLRAYLQSFALRRAGIDFKPHSVSLAIKVDATAAPGKTFDFAHSERRSGVQLGQNLEHTAFFGFADEDDLA